MLKFVGAIVMITGIILVIVGFILGQTGVYIPHNVLGLYSTSTALCVFGGAVAAFFGFAMLAVGTPPGPAALKHKEH